MTELFPFPKRFPDLPVTLFVLLYVPLGLLLVVARFFVLLHALCLSYILPKGALLRHIVLKCMGAVLGTFVTVKRDKGSLENATLVSNHPTLFDHAVLDLVVPNYSPYSHLFHWAHGYKKITQTQQSDEEIRKFLTGSDFPFHFLPEYVPTGCCDYLLHFPPVPFGLELVQPVAISVRRLLPIGLTCYPVVWWRELFWHLFVPYTHYHVHLLPAFRRCSSEETSTQFAQRLRRGLADALKARLLQLTANDLRKQLQQQVRRNPREAAGAANENFLESVSQDPHLQLMVSQVKEILPHMSSMRIEQELRNTRDVDTTITNLLEDSASSDVTSRTSPSAANGAIFRHNANTSSGNISGTVPPSSYKTGADTFDKSSKGRHLSLVDRKRDFIENARQRYLAKRST